MLDKLRAYACSKWHNLHPKKNISEVKKQLPVQVDKQSSVEPSPLYKLPEELHREIFSYLNSEELALVSTACSPLRSSSQSLTISRIRKKFPKAKHFDDDTIAKIYFNQNLLKTLVHSKEITPPRIGSHSTHDFNRVEKDATEFTLYYNEDFTRATFKPTKETSFSLTHKLRTEAEYDIRDKSKNYKKYNVTLTTEESKCLRNKKWIDPTKEESKKIAFFQQLTNLKMKKAIKGIVRKNKALLKSNPKSSPAYDKLGKLQLQSSDKAQEKTTVVEMVFRNAIMVKTENAKRKMDEAEATTPRPI